MIGFFRRYFSLLIVVILSGCINSSQNIQFNNDKKLASIINTSDLPWIKAVRTVVILPFAASGKEYLNYTYLLKESIIKEIIANNLFFMISSNDTTECLKELNIENYHPPSYVDLRRISNLLKVEGAMTLEFIKTRDLANKEEFEIRFHFYYAGIRDTEWLFSSHIDAKKIDNNEINIIVKGIIGALMREKSEDNNKLQNK